MFYENLFTIFGLDKKILIIFHFTMLTDLYVAILNLGYIKPLTVVP